MPYCLRVSEEVKIYEKLLFNSELTDAKCAPGTLELLGQFSVLSRLKEPENSSLYSKMRVYDGESLKDTDPKAKSYQEYRDYAGVDEGMNGLFHPLRVQDPLPCLQLRPRGSGRQPGAPLLCTGAADRAGTVPQELHDRYLEFIKGYLTPRYVEFIGKEIQTAYLESYSEYGQNIFDRYVTYADFWIQDQEYRDPRQASCLTAHPQQRAGEDRKPAGISNPKDFRNEIVNFVLRARPTTQAAVTPTGPVTRSCAP